MGNIYIAVNGDDVGSRIGDAIANDDHEGLAQASSSIQNAHDSIDQWVDSIGGKKVTSAGDDAIYLVPEQAVNDLDSIREDYKSQSGHGLTVGVGPSMSQASKALIYGKLNGKDQTIHYEPMMEDYLSEDEDDAAPEIPEETEVQGQADADMEQDAGAADLENAPPAEDVDDSESAVPGAEAPEDTEALVPDMDAEPEAGNEDDLADDNQAQSESPEDAAAAPDANAGAIDGKTDKDFGTSDEDLAEDNSASSPDAAAPAAPEGEDADMPDTDPADDAAAQDDGSMPPMPAADDESADQGDGADAAAMPAEGDDSEQPLSQDDVASPEEGDDQGEDPLASMIHGDMQEGGDDSEQDPDAEQGDDSSLDDELRQDIADALVSFKNNKHMLEDARETNPELYDATLTMLRSMIAMAKKLGFAPEQDMADQEAAGQLEQEFPEAGAEDQGEDPSEDMPAEEESEDDSGEESAPPSDKKEAPPAKK